LRRGPAEGFFDAASLAGFLPTIGISISFWPAAVLRGFLAAFFGALVSAAAPPTLCRSASIRSTTFSPRGRSFGLEPDTIAGPAIGARRQQRSNCAERDCSFVVVAIAHLAGFENAVLLDPFECLLVNLA
jgi:hypothetical protein